MRAVAFSIVISLALLLNGCKEEIVPGAHVRFENIMIDHYVFPYGLMLGDALFLDSLGHNDISPYLETKPGFYSLLARRVDGNWIEISEDKFQVEPGLSYTILIFGTIQEFAFQLQQD